MIIPHNRTQQERCLPETNCKQYFAVICITSKMANYTIFSVQMCCIYWVVLMAGNLRSIGCPIYTWNMFWITAFLFIINASAFTISCTFEDENMCGYRNISASKVYFNVWDSKRYDQVLWERVTSSEMSRPVVDHTYGSLRQGIIILCRLSKPKIAYCYSIRGLNLSLWLHQKIYLFVCLIIYLRFYNDRLHFVTLNPGTVVF